MTVWLAVAVLLAGASCSSNGRTACDQLLDCCKTLATSLQDQCQTAYDEVRALSDAEQRCQQAMSVYGATCQTSDGGTGALALTAIRGSQSSAIGSGAAKTQAPAGSIYTIVDVELYNGTGQGASLAAPLFTLETSAGVELLGGAETTLLARGCLQNASVTAGQKTRCAVVFATPKTAAATAIRYRAPDGRTARALVTVAPCQTCGASCVDLQTDDENCGACDAKVTIGHCEAGKPVCDSGGTPCGATCVDLKTDPNNCGACGVAITSEMVCEKGRRVCTKTGSGSTVYIACGSQCETVEKTTCKTTLTSPAACSCGALACVIGVAVYTCSSASSVKMSSFCDSVPPASTVSTGGVTCPFTEEWCVCQ